MRWGVDGASDGLGRIECRYDDSSFSEWMIVVHPLPLVPYYLLMDSLPVRTPPLQRRED